MTDPTSIEDETTIVQGGSAARRNPRWLWVCVATLGIVVVAAGAWVLLHKNAPPRAARLLPESDAIVYLDLAAVRNATHFDRKPITPDSDYQQFVSASGVDVERDLDEAALAVHRLANPLTSQGPFAYSEVFVGRLDVPHITAYLQQQAAATEQYAGHTIYSVPHDGRVVRVALLDHRTVAVSNTPQPEQIHEILDHDDSFYSKGPTLLQDYYRDVPLLSFAWGLGKVEAPLTGDGDAHLFGFRIPLPTNTVFVGSARYLDALRLRVDEFAPNPAVADASVTLARTVLSFYQGEQKLRASVGGTPDADMAELLASVDISQKDDHASLTAKVPVNLLRRVLTP